MTEGVVIADPIPYNTTVPRQALDYEEAMRRVIGQIPRGKVATYGQVAAEAGYPGYHRQVAQVLGRSGGGLPWQRVVGAGGAIKVRREDAHEQRLLLEMEGVRFRGRRVDMADHQWRGL
jgi:methylated-DNA-protein-cysteine methyltransferase-like protein